MSGQPPKPPIPGRPKNPSPQKPGIPPQRRSLTPPARPPVSPPRPGVPGSTLRTQQQEIKRDAFRQLVGQSLPPSCERLPPGRKFLSRLSRVGSPPRPGQPCHRFPCPPGWLPSRPRLRPRLPRPYSRSDSRRSLRLPGPPERPPPRTCRSTPPRLIRRSPPRSTPYNPR
jgi:hypothetical protein